MTSKDSEQTRKLRTHNNVAVGAMFAGTICVLCALIVISTVGQKPLIPVDTSPDWLKAIIIPWIIVMGMVSLWITRSRQAHLKQINDYRLARTRTGFDVSHENRPIPANVQQMISNLEKLGFREVKCVMSDLPTKHPPIHWVVFSSTGHIRAEIVLTGLIFRKPAVVFGTLFPDHAYLTTVYGLPMAEVDLPQMRVTSQTHSIDDALRIHRDRVEEFRQQYGNPLRFDSVDDLLTTTQEYSKYHQPILADLTKRSSPQNRSLILQLGAGFILFLILTIVVLSVPFTQLGLACASGITIVTMVTAVLYLNQLR